VTQPEETPSNLAFHFSKLPELPFLQASPGWGKRPVWCAGCLLEQWIYLFREKTLFFLISWYFSTQLFSSAASSGERKRGEFEDQVFCF
jgi:hypothetical protein